MATSDEEVVTAISSEGDANVLVCKTDETEAKVCLDTGAQTEKGMLDNNTYNLIEQLAHENKSLWRIKNSYKNDAEDDNETLELWNKIEKDKEEIVKLLIAKLRERL